MPESGEDSRLFGHPRDPMLGLQLGPKRLSFLPQFVSEGGQSRLEGGAARRRALPDSLGVKSAAVAAHDLDLRPPREPICGLVGRAGLQQVGNGSV
jgi:hypothetical protein